MKKPTNLFRLVSPQAALFEPANPDHFPVQLDLLVAGKPGVDGSFGMVRRWRGQLRRVSSGGRRAGGLAWPGRFFGSGCRFLAHGRSINWWKRLSVRWT